MQRHTTHETKTRSALFTALLLTLGLGGATADEKNAPEKKSEPETPIRVIAEPGKPAVISLVTPTIELSRSIEVLPAQEAERYLGQPEVTVAHFPINADTMADAVVQARQKGYFDSSASGSHLRNRPAGRTNWRIEWNVPRGPDGTHDLKGLTLSWGAFVILPEWKGPPTNSAVVVDREFELRGWRKFYEALRIHEAHHVKLVTDEVKGFEERFHRRVRDGDPLDPKAISEELRKLLDTIKAADQEIDRRFGHQ